MPLRRLSSLPTKKKLPAACACARTRDTYVDGNETTDTREVLLYLEAMLKSTTLALRVSSMNAYRACSEDKEIKTYYFLLECFPRPLEDSPFVRKSLRLSVSHRLHLHSCRVLIKRNVACFYVPTARVCAEARTVPFFLPSLLTLRGEMSSNKCTNLYNRNA